MRILTLTVILFLAACASQGHPFDMEKAHDLQPGVSTIEDAERLIGKPVSVTHNANGHTVLIWTYAYATGLGPGGAKQLIIPFDETGTMIRIASESTL